MLLQVTFSSSTLGSIMESNYIVFPYLPVLILIYIVYEYNNLSLCLHRDRNLFVAECHISTYCCAFTLFTKQNIFKVAKFSFQLANCWPKHIQATLEVLEHLTSVTESKLACDSSLLSPLSCSIVQGPCY